MFRTTLTLVMVFSMTNTVFAADRSANASNQTAVSSSKNEALEIMQDHMRSQMDWRSYFTNRMDARRRVRLSAKKLRDEPSTANADLPR